MRKDRWSLGHISGLITAIIIYETVLNVPDADMTRKVVVMVVLVILNIAMRQVSKVL